MFIPIFIAMLLGLISPTQQTSNTNGQTIYVSNNGTENDPESDDDGGGGGSGGGSTGGNTGQNPPPKDEESLGDGN